MQLSAEDLNQIAARTLAHYEQHARSYWEGTRDHDVSQNIAALLKHLPEEVVAQLRGLSIYELLAKERVLTALPYRVLVK